METEFGRFEVTYTARGLRRYVLELRHDGLRRYQLVRGDSEHVVRQKAATLASPWDEAWTRVASRLRREAQVQVCQAEADRRTADASAELAGLEGLLAHTLAINDAVDWETLRDTTLYAHPRPPPPALPSPPAPPVIPPEPRPTDPPFVPRLGVLDRLFRKRTTRKVAAAETSFRGAHADWQRRKARAEQDGEAALAAHRQAITELTSEHSKRVAQWEADAAEFARSQQEHNSAIEAKKTRYLEKDPAAVSDHCDMVLGNSTYPDCFPRTWSLDFVAESNLLVVDYQLPAPTALPTLVSVRYVKSRGDFEEKHMSESQKNRFYNSVLYQVALRTIHELFEGDVVGAIDTVAFNGIVESVDPSSGHPARACILSVQTGREEFLRINLAAVDPKACFRKLRGVGRAKLHSLTPVAPLIQFDKSDPRFVDGYNVAVSLDEGRNLAAMDWEDFEHLIRELFEMEFCKTGGDVKVTRASRDGGIDAVVFDPDPLRGGKIVIQAKRYTNTVSVSAVRDLYGAVINEGANKGILVTTADYGPDAYEFARGKPLQLLSGNHLLHLLQQHGIRARIDLREAREPLGS